VTAQALPRVHVDVNVLDEDRPEGGWFHQLNDEGRLRLHLADIGAREANDATDPVVHAGLLCTTADMEEAAGVFVLDHSLLDGGGEPAAGGEAARLDAVHRAIWFRSWQDDADNPSGNARRRLRDSMHVDTAIRQAADVFVTRDGDVLEADDAIHAQWGLRVLSPPDARAWLEPRLRP
jgi:hypothetical protein